MKVVVCLHEGAQMISEIGQKDGHAFMITGSVDKYETADKALDEAYRRGFDDGKDSTAKGCEGCKYKDRGEHDSPCKQCRRNFFDWYGKQKGEDSIKVGDEVEVLDSGSKYLIAWIVSDDLCGFSCDGIFCRLKPSDVRKTGRHFDIEGILKAMQEGE